MLVRASMYTRRDTVGTERTYQAYNGQRHSVAGNRTLRHQRQVRLIRCSLDVVALYASKYATNAMNTMKARKLRNERS